MGGGKDNHHADKGCYPPIGYPPVHSNGSYASAAPVAYPYPYPNSHGSLCAPPLGSYPHTSPMYSSHSSGYPPYEYPSYNQSTYPSIGGYPGATHHHGRPYFSLTARRTHMGLVRVPAHLLILSASSSTFIPRLSLSLFSATASSSHGDLLLRPAPTASPCPRRAPPRPHPRWTWRTRRVWRMHRSLGPDARPYPTCSSGPWLLAGDEHSPDPPSQHHHRVLCPRIHGAQLFAESCEGHGGANHGCTAIGHILWLLINLGKAMSTQFVLMLPVQNVHWMLDKGLVPFSNTSSHATAAPLLQHFQP